MSPTYLTFRLLQISTIIGTLLIDLQNSLKAKLSIISSDMR